MCRVFPCEQILTKFCTTRDMEKIIICVSFDVDKFLGLEYRDGAKFGFSH